MVVYQKKEYDLQLMGRNLEHHSGRHIVKQHTTTRYTDTKFS